MDRPTTWSVDYRKLSKFITNINTPAHAEVFILVSSVGARWNTLYPSLVELDQRLQELGLVEIDGKIVFLAEKENENA